MKQKRKQVMASERSRASAAPDPWLRFAVWAAPAAVALLAFVHTLPYKFVFDDEGQILRNPWIRDWSNLKTIFATDVWRFSDPAGVTNYYRPLHMLLYMLGYHVFGLEPRGYHALSILLHSLSTVLVTSIGLRLTGDRRVAVLGGLLFALHPVHAESVAWVAAVPDLLCAAFFFSALRAHLAGAEQGLRRAAAPLCFLGALLSKEMAFAFPAVAAWADLSLGRRLRASRYAAYAGAFALYAALRVHALGRFLVPQVPLDLDPYSRFLSRVVLAGDYVLKLFAPYDLRPYYVFTPTRTMLSAEFAAAAAALVALGAVAVWLRRRRDALFLTGYTLLALAPLLSLSYGWESVFQVRYLYIPSLGACLLAALAARAVPVARLPAPATVALAGGVLAACAVQVGRTTWIWRDDAAFYAESIRRAPGSMLMANSLGRYCLAQGDYDAAERWHRRALELSDGSFLKREIHRSKAYEGLGMVYLKRRDLVTARDYFVKAFEATPESFDALLSLGTIHGGLGDYAAALDYYRRALAKNPRSEVVYNNIAGALVALGRYDEAIAEAQNALRIYPGLAEAYVIIGRAHAGKGEKDQARSAYRKAREVDPNAARFVEKQLRLLDEAPAPPDRPSPP